MEIDSQQDRVGFTVKIFINLEEIDKFICAICKNVLRDAAQIPESNDPKRACLDCYKNNIRYVSSFLMKFFTEFCYFDQFPHLKEFCQLFEIIPAFFTKLQGRKQHNNTSLGICEAIRPLKERIMVIVQVKKKTSS